MIREEQLDDKKIVETLTNDPLGRNQQLNTFLGLLNSINKNTILTIDGEWGSGKTVFVKQIEYLAQNNVDQLQSLDHVITEEFQNNYDVYYFNAWENDYHDNPLESILFSLINDIWGKKERAADKVTKHSKAFVKSVLKTTSLGLYDPNEIRNAESISDLTKSITTASERKKAIEDIISNHLDLNGKKLLFVVDELDRCKPTYAVNLLETIKHYYSNDKLIFLLSTNNRQLSHTIRKVYGQSFDGSGYLNKFYDLIFNLPDIKAEKYIEYLGHDPRSSYWKDMAPLEVANYLELSIRQINRYYSSLRLIKNYMESTNIFSDRELSGQLVKYVLIPLAYGLRIKDFEDYTRFVNGDGVDILKNFYKKSNTLNSIFRKSPIKDEVNDTATTLAEIYAKLFNDSPSDGDSYHIIESADAFKRTVHLINASGMIDDKPRASERQQD